METNKKNNNTKNNINNNDNANTKNNNKSKKNTKVKKILSIKENHTVIVKLDSFLYLREPDWVLLINIDTNNIYDYETEQKLKLDDYQACIVLDHGFIPNSTFLVLNNKNDNGIYQSNKISKKCFYKKYVNIPNKNDFRLKIDKDGKISPKYLVAKIKNFDKNKKYIDLKINSFYKIKIK